VVPASTTSRITSHRPLRLRVQPGGRHVEVDAVEHDGRPEALAQRSRRDHRASHRASFCACRTRIFVCTFYTVVVPVEELLVTDAGSPGDRGAAAVRDREKPRLRAESLGLTLARITAAREALADAEGLAAVSMAQVAESLGVTTMALYRYLAGKDELLALMSDAAIGMPLPTAPGGAAGSRPGATGSTR